MAASPHGCWTPAQLTVHVDRQPNQQHSTTSSLAQVINNGSCDCILPGIHNAHCDSQLMACSQHMNWTVLWECSQHANWTELTRTSRPSYTRHSLVTCVSIMTTTTHTLTLLLFRHAPLGGCSAICRHQPPPRTVLGQVDCFVQCEVVGSQIVLEGVQPHATRTPRWSLPVIWWGSR